jgi:four helix bundle protein
MHDFRKLEVWQEAKQLTKQIYKEVQKFPKEEMFGLSSQIKRAAISVPSNIAEGAGRKTDKDFANFLSYAIGSAYEIETQLELSAELGFMDKEVAEKLISATQTVERKLFNLRRRLIG